MMITQQRNRVRIDESRYQMLALDGELTSWLIKRRNDDERHQYHTQLESIEATLRSALVELGQALAAVDPKRSPGEVYDDCRAFDIRVIWLRRVWDFFREKFDQRDDPRFRSVLKAADEVVWSCYRPAFLRAQVEAADLDAGPAPLPYIESRYSPEAFPRELVPQDLKREVDLTFLSTHLAALPVPLVRLPPSSAESPWELVYLGHELGHHVQYRLLPNRKLVDDCADCIGKAVWSVASDAEERWRNWSREIFADFYSVLLMGSWAAPAMLELELRRRPDMSAARASYPSPMLRIYLMLETTRLLGLPEVEGLRVDLLVLADDTAALHAEKAIATRVATDLLGLTAYDRAVRDLSGYDPNYFETDVPEWIRELRANTEPHAVESLEAARLATAGAVAAWTAVRAEPDDDIRAQSRAQLRQRSLSVIAGCRAPGTRDAPVETAPSDLGKRLAAALLDRDATTLQTLREGA